MKRLMTLAVVMLCLTTLKAQAADTRWIGTDEDWSNTDWWVGGLEPTAAHSCQIDGSVIVSKPDEVVGRGFYVGRYSGDDATVKIISGDLTVSDSAQTTFFGYSGKGTLEMIEGQVDFTALCILGLNSGAEGLWTVDGGAIDAESIRVGDAGTGTIIQSAGAVICHGITLGDNDGSAGTYEISGGDLTTSWLRFGPNRFRTAVPTVNILSRTADITLTGDLSFYSANSVFTAVSGSAIDMVGQYADVINEMNAANAENVAGLANLTLEFSDNAAGGFCTYEVASEDLGADAAGYCGGNFTLNTLAVGGDTPGKVVLVDSFDNGNRAGGSECLYVRNLIVTAGSTLDLNGLNLYYQQADIAGTIDDGTPQQIWTLDMNDDGVVAEYELMTIAANWLNDTCACPDLCGGADVDANGKVDLFDLAILLENWQTSNSATFYVEHLDSDPGWTTEGQWAFGVPTGGGGGSYGNADPTGGATDSNVYGVNLAGDYSVAMTSGYRWVTTDTIDCTGKYGVELRFKRWLNVDVQSRVVAMVDVYDGSYWYHYAWVNGATPTTDAGWVDCAYDISAWADNNPDVRIRWGYWVKAGALPYSGWNIDDIELVENP